jgi:hypothetical protein
MSSKRKRCAKHKGMTVSFGTENCPVCIKDEEIKRLDLSKRLLLAFIYWCLDYLRLSHYEGIDNQERQTKMEKIYNDIASPSTSIEQTLKILEEYGELRKTLSWN